MNINLTLIGELIAFIVFVWFCMAKVWPPIMAAIEERQKKIADGLEASERAEKDLELAQAKATEQLNACKGITSKWNAAQIKCRGSCHRPIVPAIRMKISSPAYKLPNRRSDNDSGLASSDTNSKTKLNQYNQGVLNGWAYSSFKKPPTPLILIL